MSSEAAILEQVPQILLVVLNIKPIANAEQPCSRSALDTCGHGIQDLLLIHVVTVFKLHS